jgi:hypothetical protein
MFWLAMLSSRALLHWLLCTTNLEEIFSLFTTKRKRTAKETKSAYYSFKKLVWHMEGLFFYARILTSSARAFQQVPEVR